MVPMVKAHKHEPALFCKSVLQAFALKDSRFAIMHTDSITRVLYTYVQNTVCVNRLLRVHDDLPKIHDHTKAQVLDGPTALTRSMHSGHSVLHFGFSMTDKNDTGHKQ